MRSQANKPLPLALAVLLGSLLLLLTATAQFAVPASLSVAKTGSDHNNTCSEHTLAPDQPVSLNIASEALLEERDESDLSQCEPDACIIPTSFHARSAAHDNSCQGQPHTRRLTANNSRPLFLVTARIRI